MLIEVDSTTEVIVKMITDVGDGSQKRTFEIPFEWNPKGGIEICEQWVVAALNVVVNGTYEVRLRLRVEAITLYSIHWNDIELLSLNIEAFKQKLSFISCKSS